MTNDLRTLIIYHDKCHDGVTALWVALRRFPDAEHFGASYGPDQKRPPPEVWEKIRGARVIVVDFCYKTDTMLEIWRSCEELIVLDHHKTAAADMLELVRIAAQDDPTGTRHKIVFDMERSGAGLAWDHLIGGLRPLLVDTVEDRDLWRFRLPETKALHAWMGSYPLDLEHRKMIASSLDSSYWHTEQLAAGGAILRYHAQLVEEACKQALIETISIDARALPQASPTAVTFAAFTEVFAAVPTVHCSNKALVSDIGHRLLQIYPDAPFAAAVLHNADGTLSYSLRSEDSRADVSVVAHAKGGGGHRNAAGFEKRGV